MWFNKDCALEAPAGLLHKSDQHGRIVPRSRGVDDPPLSCPDPLHPNSVQMARTVGCSCSLTATLLFAHIRLHRRVVSYRIPGYAAPFREANQPKALGASQRHEELDPMLPTPRRTFVAGGGGELPFFPTCAASVPPIERACMNPIRPTMWMFSNRFGSDRSLGRPVSSGSRPSGVAAQTIYIFSWTDSGAYPFYCISSSTEVCGANMVALFHRADCGRD